MAVMSTTVDATAAAAFASAADDEGQVAPLIFKYVSKSFMSYGADNSFLSVCPVGRGKEAH